MKYSKSVEQIHQEFYTASEKIVQFACPEKAKTLYSLGFTSSADAIEFSPEREALRNLILTYQFHYPNNKFITEDEVQKICAKYKLICGPVSVYTGKVPDSKVNEIASFKIKSEHVCPAVYRYDIKYHTKSEHYAPPTWLTAKSKWHKVLPKTVETPYPDYSTFDMERYLNKIYQTGITYLVDSMEQTKVHLDGLFICAPENEMKTEGLTKKGLFAFMETKRHIEDPVVLHPCKGGFLIVAAWGPEASDEDVVNHKMN
jgi:hypothetical protein